MLMVLELMSQEMMVEGEGVKPCWQGKVPEINLPVKTRHVNSPSFIRTIPLQIYFMYVSTLFLFLDFFFFINV